MHTIVVITDKLSYGCLSMIVITFENRISSLEAKKIDNTSGGFSVYVNGEGDVVKVLNLRVLRKLL